jgi:hypothetical protein
MEIAVKNARALAFAAVILFPGQSLVEGTYAESSGGTYRLWMQTNGNLLIRKTADDTVIWDLSKYGAWPTKVVGPYRMVLKVRTASVHTD